MTNPVIDAVRLSLGRTAETPVSPRPDIIRPRQAGSTESEIERFFQELSRLSGVGMHMQPEGIAAALKSLIDEQKIKKATVWNTPVLNRLRISDCLRTLGVGLVAPNAGKHIMAQCELGVTEADFILPETGTLVLRSSEEMPRAVSLLPRVHLAIVTDAALRADLHQVFAEAKDSHYLVFITGPSRTSDIELTPTLGMHGPKFLLVWVLDNSFLK